MVVLHIAELFNCLDKKKSILDLFRVDIYFCSENTPSAFCPQILHSYFYKQIFSCYILMYSLASSQNKMIHITRLMKTLSHEILTIF